MSRHAPSLTPRLKPLSPRKSTVLSVLDVGTSKVVCLVARLDPVVESDLLRGRTHRARIIGIGHQRARGLKGGAIVDPEAAEQSIRLAVDAAERMAKVEIQAAILNMTGGRLGSESYHAEVALRGNGVTDGDIHRVLEAASTTGARPGRTVLHSLPTGFGLDAMKGIHDPHGMVGERLGVDMHIVSTDQNAVRLSLIHI